MPDFSPTGDSTSDSGDSVGDSTGDLSSLDSGLGGSALNFSNTDFADIGPRVPGYQLLHSLGKGGQASVYKAIRLSTKQVVAAKIFHDGFGQLLEARARLDREARALKVIRHPGVVDFIDHGETDDGLLFLIMEYVEGSTLNEHVRNSAPSLSLREQLGLMLQVCDAMSAAHRAGITHRDLSPSNIIVNRYGTLKIVDFGLARATFDVLFDGGRSITGGGFFVGKREYASPEQVKNAAIEPPSDVFSIGVMLYKILSNGRPPFSLEGDALDLAFRIVKEPHLEVGPLSDMMPKHVREALSAVIDRSLAKDPKNRFQNAKEQGAALEAAVRAWDIALAAPTASEPAARADAPRPDWEFASTSAESRRDRRGEPAGKARDEERATAPPPRSTAPAASSRSTPHTANRPDMSVTDARHREALVAWARSVREAIQPHGDATDRERIDAALKRLGEDRFTLAVMGKAKRGKSTLINALLGRRDDLVAPIDYLPASSTITRIRYAEKEKATVRFQDNRCLSIPFRSIREYATEDANRGNHKAVAEIVVEGPFRDFDGDLELVDTPGAGSIHEHHDALLHQFIPSADAVIFLISARMPLADDEVELLAKLRENDVRKVFFVLNRVDECTREQIDQALAHNMQVIERSGIPFEHSLLELSAKLAYQGRTAQSRLPELIAVLRTFLAQEKGRVLAERFVSQVKSAAQPAIVGLTAAVASGAKSDEELQRELAALRDRKVAIARDSADAEERFLATWASATDQLESSLMDASAETRDRVLRQIDDCPILSLSSFAKRLPTLVARSLEETTLPGTRQFESTIRDACESLRVSYPSLSLGSTGCISVTTSLGSQVLVAAAGGALATAAGFSLASAGATAAASLAATTVTVSVPTVASSLLASTGVWVGSLFGEAAAGSLGSALGALGTGTATVATPATAPLWVAFAGPIGWSLVGIGVLVVPIAWRLAKLKQKDRIRQQVADDIRALFVTIQRDRLPFIRRAAKPIVAEFSSSLNRQVQQIEASLQQLLLQRPDPSEVVRKSRSLEGLRSLLATVPGEPAEANPVGGGLGA